MSRPDDLNPEIQNTASSTSPFAAKLNATSRIALIGAMDQEIERLKHSITDIQEEQIAGFMFYSGKIGAFDVVLLKSGIGKVNAAIGTCLLLDRFKPDCVINTGSAGGFDPELKVGDVVISDEVRHHDVDLRVFGYEIGQMARMPAAYYADALLVEVAETSVAEMQGMACSRGLIATGDAFMSDPEHVAKVRANFPTMKAAEMEAAAIAQTCFRFDTPFIVIRALSDIAGQESNISFDQFIDTASENSAQMVLKIVTALAERV
ncbi:MAG TPA: 5'-methylthioadenosine/S-adenosylhomocysteine nucleosidase [Marinobacterium sp.]|nr:5'-methylthioadenosine/S-adenosylhomocysteine nucleosidase [Marinobacterium sp.]